MKQAYKPPKLPLDFIDWASHVSLIARANAALARYDGILEVMVNPALLLSPLATQEAVLSSRIERTQATLEEVLEFEADPSRKIEPAKHADIQEIINYRKARAILDLYEEMKQKVPAITRSQYAIQAIDTLFDKPVFGSGDFISRSLTPKDSAFRILNGLKQAELIQILREGKGRKAAVMIFGKLLEITEHLS